ncbi:sodium/calcium exchanger Calx-like [Amphiura filiformis]|uniref:sodium/calcium exchanger Calx-like n=1 Tax=Amphiura filiformis TaxID=82378 RepID=UPI003B20EE90
MLFRRHFDVVFKFEREFYSVVESDANQTLAINVVQTGPGTTFATINLSVLDINTYSSDYTVPSYITWGSDDFEKTFDVVIVGDTDVEEIECFELTLIAPTTGILASCHITTTICIKDDDASVDVFKFEREFYCVLENDTSLEVKVIRTGGGTDQSMITLVETDITTSSSDYTVPTSVTFRSGRRHDC